MNPVRSKIVMWPFRFDFPVITNSDYGEELSFQADGSYLDITGHSFSAQIKATPSSGTVIATLSTVGSPIEGFYLIDPTHGALQVRIKWETIKAMFLSAYSDYLVGDQVSLYYDLLVTLPGGDQEVWTFGYMHVVRGITNG